MYIKGLFRYNWLNNKLNISFIIHLTVPFFQSTVHSWTNPRSLLCRIYSIIMCVMGNSTVASMLVLPLLFSDEKGLPIPVWLPSFIWNNIWIAYVYETMAMFATVMVNANSDVAISGLMWEACTQFDLARHRLEELPRRLRQAIDDEKTPKEMLMRIEKESVELAAYHHNHIIECSFIRFFNSYKVARCKSATHI